MNSKKILGIVLALSLINLTITTEVKAESTSNPTTTEENLENKNLADYPAINEEDWRSLSFDKIPWSVPVVAKDDFDGDQLAVMDRNKSGGMFLFGKESGIVSMWAENKIRVYYYLREDSESILENDKWTIQEAETLSIKVGDEVFRLEGRNGNFQVEDELAQALANAPEGKTKIKFTLEGGGADNVSEIGAKTVKAWKTVYAKSGEVATE